MRNAWEVTSILADPSFASRLPVAWCAAGTARAGAARTERAGAPARLLPIADREEGGAGRAEAAERGSVSAPRGQSNRGRTGSGATSDRRPAPVPVGGPNVMSVAPYLLPPFDEPEDLQDSIGVAPPPNALQEPILGSRPWEMKLDELRLTGVSAYLAWNDEDMIYNPNIRQAISRAIRDCRGLLRICVYGLTWSTRRR